MKKNGFTLIELLAVIVILGVILVIAIPSISAAILNSRKNSYVATANEFADGLRMMTLIDPTLLPSGTDSTCKSLSAIKLEKGSSTRSPFGKDYDATNSKVCVAYNSTTSEYDYKVCLVDTGGNSICDITTEDGNTTYKPVEIKTVTKDTVAVGGSIPEQEPEPDPEPEPTYVSTNMLVWLDGIDNTTSGHSATTTTWYDLSGNNNSPLFHTNGTLAWNDNNFSFNGGASSVFNFPTTLNSFQLAGNWTVEIRLSRSTNTTLDVIFGNNNGNSAFGIFHRAGSNTYELFNALGSGVYYSSNATVTAGVATTIAVTYTPGIIKFYQNGELKNTVNATLLSPGGNATPQGLGSYGNWYDSVYSFGGNIYSLRVYNKVLSDTEIAGNYAIDQTRFQ